MNPKDKLFQPYKCICGAAQGEKHLVGCPRNGYPMGRLERAENLLPEKSLPPEADWTEAIAHLDSLLEKNAESRKMMRHLRVRMVLRNKPAPAVEAPEASIPEDGVSENGVQSTLSPGR